MNGKFDALMKPVSENKEIQAWWHFFLRTCMHDDESRTHFVALMKSLQGTDQGLFSIRPSKKDVEAQMHYLMDNFENTFFADLGTI
jgi:hypothetical protein